MNSTSALGGMNNSRPSLPSTNYSSGRPQVSRVTGPPTKPAMFASSSNSIPSSTASSTSESQQQHGPVSRWMPAAPPRLPPKQAVFSSRPTTRGKSLTMTGCANSQRSLDNKSIQSYLFHLSTMEGLEEDDLSRYAFSLQEIQDWVSSRSLNTGTIYTTGNTTNKEKDTKSAKRKDQDKAPEIPNKLLTSPGTPPTDCSGNSSERAEWNSQCPSLFTMDDETIYTTLKEFRKFVIEGDLPELFSKNNTGKKLPKLEKQESKPRQICVNRIAQNEKVNNEDDTSVVSGLTMNTLKRFVKNNKVTTGGSCRTLESKGVVQLPPLWSTTASGGSKRSLKTPETAASSDGSPASSDGIVKTPNTNRRNERRPTAKTGNKMPPRRWSMNTANSMPSCEDSRPKLPPKRWSINSAATFDIDSVELTMLTQTNLMNKNTSNHSSKPGKRTSVASSNLTAFGSSDSIDELVMMYETENNKKKNITGTSNHSKSGLSSKRNSIASSNLTAFGSSDSIDELVKMYESNNDTNKKNITSTSTHSKPSLPSKKLPTASSNLTTAAFHTDEAVEEIMRLCCEPTTNKKKNLIEIVRLCEATTTHNKKKESESPAPSKPSSKRQVMTSATTQLSSDSLTADSADQYEENLSPPSSSAQAKRSSTDSVMMDSVDQSCESEVADTDTVYIIQALEAELNTNGHCQYSRATPKMGNLNKMGNHQKRAMQKIYSRANPPKTPPSAQAKAQGKQKNKVAPSKPTPPRKQKQVPVPQKPSGKTKQPQKGKPKPKPKQGLKREDVIKQLKGHVLSLHADLRVKEESKTMYVIEDTQDFSVQEENICSIDIEASEPWCCSRFFGMFSATSGSPSEEDVMACYTGNNVPPRHTGMTSQTMADRAAVGPKTASSRSSKGKPVDDDKASPKGHFQPRELRRTRSNVSEHSVLSILFDEEVIGDLTC